VAPADRGDEQVRATDRETPFGKIRRYLGRLVVGLPVESRQGDGRVDTVQRRGRE
jgi:hypothetical protein